MRDSLLQACPLCSGKLSKNIEYPGSDRTSSRLSFHSICVCESCGGGTALPRPSQEDLDQFYSSGAYWKSTTDELQLAHESSQAQIRLIACLPHFSVESPASVADVGAGHGFIGRELARSVLRTVRYDCVEPDETAGARICSLKLPFPARRFRSVDELESGFNLLFLNQVIEHVADPFLFLQHVLSRATPGAIVYVETPNSDYKFKPDVFPHTFFYTERALTTLGRRLSVETLCCETFGCWPSPRGTLRGFTQRLASQAYAAGAKLGLQQLPRILDRFIWHYDQTGLDSGIWLRWIFRTPNHRN